MTHAQFIDAVKNLVKDRAKPGVRTKDSARDLLVREGIVTRSGQLTPEYGGDKAKKKQKSSRTA